MPLKIFHNKTRSGSYIIRLLFMMSVLPYWFYIPQLMQSQYGFSPFISGLAMFPVTIVNFVVAMRLTNIIHKWGNSKVLLIGESILSVGLLWTAFINYDIGYWKALFIPLILLGIGQGLILAPATNAGIHKTTSKLSGVASGVTNTAHQIGGPIGLSIITAFSSNTNNRIPFMAVFSIIAIVVVKITQKNETYTVI